MTADLGSGINFPKKTAFSTLRIAALAIILILGIFLRFEHLSEWRKDPTKTIYLEEPLITTFDGYYYLRYARDLAEGNYKKIDSLRLTPHHPLRPSPPPLLSIITAVLMKFTGASQGWITGFLPALLGVLIVFPVFLIGKTISGHLTGLFAALVGLCSPMYVARTGFGRYDTDCGNVTFTMLAVYFSMMIFKTRGYERIFHIIAYVINFLLFFLWWDTAPQVTITICIVPLLLSFALLSKNRKLEAKYLVFAGFFVILLVTNWKGVSYWKSLPESFIGILDYVTRAEKGSFPAVGITVSEQSKLSFYEMVVQSSGSLPLFIASTVGIIILFLKNFRIALLLFPPLFLGGFSFFYAQRFSIFLAPLIGIGTGFLFHILVNKTHFKYRTTTCIFFALILIVPLIHTNLNKEQLPSEPAFMVEGMVTTGKTPPGSVIWAWWDHGHAMMYWSRRSTISDGASHGGELSMINAFPMATTDFRQSANWMHFYVSRGRAGFIKVYNKVGNVGKGLSLIKEIMAAGPAKSLEILVENQLVPTDKWILFFFPPEDERKDIYLFLDSKLTAATYWWYWLGSWRPELKDGIHPIFRVFTDIVDKEEILTGSPLFVLKKADGIFSFEEENIKLSRIITNKNDRWSTTPFRSKGLVFQFNSDFEGGVLCSGNIFESVFNRLFFLRMTDLRYFKAVQLNQPSFQIWKVKGDTIPE